MFLLVVAVVPGWAHAGEGEFALGVGYSRIDFDGDSPLTRGRDGVHFDPSLSLSPFDGLPQLRVGAAVGFSAALDDVHDVVVSSGGGTFAVSGSDATLLLWEPELRLAWRQHFGTDGLGYVEAGVAGGAVIAWLGTGDGDDSGPDGADFEDTEASWSARAFVRVGVPFSTGIAGVEASYLRGGRMDFAKGVGGELDEYYVGVFGALSF
jgi:hypothetical protein